MRHQPTAFEQLVQEIPWDTFERLAGEYGVDAAARSFGARDHLMAMLGAALGGFHGACGKPWQGCFPAAARCG